MFHSKCILFLTWSKKKGVDHEPLAQLVRVKKPVHNFFKGIAMRIEDANFVREVSSIETAEDELVDAIELEDGQVIVIDGGSIVLYHDMEDLLEGDARKRPSIAL